MRKKGIILGLCLLPFAGGCTLLGFLLSPSSSERKVPARFPLADHKEEILYLVIRGTQGSGVDVDVPGLLARAIKKDLRQHIKMKDQSILDETETKQYSSFTSFSWTQVEQNARRAGASFLLYVEIIGYDLVPIHKQDYYIGSLTARSVLMDVRSGEILWPAEETGRVVRTAVDFERKGRSEILWRLTTATSHCIVREFYNCPLASYSVSEEVKYLDAVMKDLN